MAKLSLDVEMHTMKKPFAADVRSDAAMTQDREKQAWPGWTDKLSSRLHTL
jgi:hypothetical protein